MVQKVGYKKYGAVCSRLSVEGSITSQGDKEGIMASKWLHGKGELWFLIRARSDFCVVSARLHHCSRPAFCGLHPLMNARGIKHAGVCEAHR